MGQSFGIVFKTPQDMFVIHSLRGLSKTNTQAEKKQKAECFRIKKLDYQMDYSNHEYPGTNVT